MSKIDGLIQELCPHGVKYLELKALALIGTGSSDKKDSDGEGAFPFYVRSKEVFLSSRAEFDETAILIPGEGGIGEIFHFQEGPYALHQRAYRVAPVSPDVSPKYLFYYMVANFKEHILSKAVSATVTSIRKPMIERFRVAVPPLPVQHEIVSILDKFTQLEAELEAELGARKTQYEVTRDRLLDFSSDPEGHPLRHMICDLSADGVSEFQLAQVSSIRIGEFVKKDRQSEEFAYPVYNGGTTETGYYSEYNFPARSVVIAARGSIGFVNYLWTKFWAGNSCYVVRPLDDSLNSRFLFHTLKSKEKMLYDLRAVGGIPALNLGPVSTLLIPKPPLAIQDEIVSILDKLDALVNDITIGLPAEIAARRKQYEYYRNKLLTFKELEAA